MAKEKLQVWITTEIKEQLENYCSANDTNQSQIVRKLLRDFFKK